MSNNIMVHATYFLILLWTLASFKGDPVVINFELPPLDPWIAAILFVIMFTNGLQLMHTGFVWITNRGKKEEE